MTEIRRKKTFSNNSTKRKIKKISRSEKIKATKDLIIQDGIEKRKEKKVITKKEYKEPTRGWIEDKSGKQGEVYLNDGRYWGVKILPDGKTTFISWSKDEWKVRKN